MDPLDKLPLPKTINYTEEEKDILSRFIEPDNPSESKNEWGTMQISLKNLFIIFILFCIFANTYFHAFLDTITYFNGSPLKIYIASGTLFLLSSLIILYYVK